MNDHRWTMEHLTWYINGTLVGEEYARAHRHLSSCVVCQREHHAQSQIAEAVATPATTSVEASAALSLFDSINDASRHRSPPWLRYLRTQMARTPGTVRYLVVVQTLVVVIAAGWLWNAQDSQTFPADYQTLSQGNGRDGDIRVLFSPDTTQQELLVLFDKFDARIVDGPSHRGVYTITVAARDLSAIVSGLRQSPAVQFAEPMHPEMEH